MRQFAPAKVNLSLSVTGRRADGYHQLDSLVAFADVGDWLEAHPAENLALTITGPEAVPLQREDPARNLVLRAAEALRQAAGEHFGAHLQLDKYLPVASGIGGGSADAAAALHLLNRLWALHWPLERLQAVGLPLGADIPVCLLGQASRMRGIGERLTPVRLQGAEAILLANPRRAVSTREVFVRLSLPSATLPPDMAGDIYHPDDLRLWGNDLETAAIGLVPEILSLLHQLKSLPGVQLARMSGSGATCFALFASLWEAAEAEAQLVAQFPDYWVAQARLLP